MLNLDQPSIASIASIYSSDNTDISLAVVQRSAACSRVITLFTSEQE